MIANSVQDSRGNVYIQAEAKHQNIYTKLDYNCIKIFSKIKSFV